MTKREAGEEIAGVAVERLEVAVSGGRLQALRLGPADASAVLAVHGITGNGLAWLATARALAGRASLIVPDLRGRAASRELPPPYGTAAYVADLVAMIEQLGLGRPLVAGHSLGAYVVARLGVEHPEVVDSLLLVDGGLTIPGVERIADPQQFVDAFLGPALARLRMRFADAATYHDWWHAHPAFGGDDVEDSMLLAYADHDLIGVAPELHSSVREAAVRTDAEELPTLGSWAQRLTTPAKLLCAPRGLLDEPSPMQPIELAEEWAAGSPDRVAEQVADVNHYTITLGTRGGAAVAAAILDALPAVTEPAR